MNLEKDLLEYGLRIDKRDLLESRVCEFEKIGDDVMVFGPGINVILSSRLQKIKPLINRPRKGSISFYGSEYRRELTQIYKLCINLDSLCVDPWNYVFFLHIKVRILEGEGLILGHIINGINYMLTDQKISFYQKPKGFTYTFNHKIVRDPTKAELGSSISIVLVNDLVLFLECLGEECDFKYITKCINYSIKMNSI